MKKINLLIALLLFFLPSTFSQKQFTLQSPDKRLVVNIFTANTIEYQVIHAGDIMLEKSPISMELDNNIYWGINPKLSKSKTATIDEVISAKIYKKNSIKNNCNELRLQFKGNYNLIFRAYNDGIVYRFETGIKTPFKVIDEQIELNFPADQNTYIPYVSRSITEIDKQFFNSFENTYSYLKLSEWDPKRLAFTPLLSKGPKGKNIVFMEADLLNYPGAYLHNDDGSTTLKGVFAKYPKEIKQGGHNMLQGIVESRENYIAKFEGPTVFPWRIILVSENDKNLADNDMVYKLATPSKGDYSWVKPGKVAWDWWNAWNLRNVDFVSGINNETYKYYIDFASEYGMEYVILDEGWAVNKQADLYQIVPEIDLKYLIRYAEERNIGLILWAGYYALNKDIEGICKHYSEMGIKGFKVDFMDRDDQPIVEFHRELAEVGARYRLLIDYHGTYKPTGLQRTYPNVINFEGVYGLEQLKWGNADQVTYDVTMPFIRMLAGPVDYTQGAMRNATKQNFRAVNSEAMSQGTRCRQLAEYVVFESPLNMLCDNPSNYKDESECTRFIADVPTIWDETVSLNGEISKYITIARRSGDTWYIGSLTNWDKRELELDLTFLDEGNYSIEVFRDGINADKVARDYIKETLVVSSDRKLNMSLAPGGGFVAKIYPLTN